MRLTDSDRIKMLYRIRDAGLITSITKAKKEYSDSQIINLNSKAIEIEKDRNVRSLNQSIIDLNDTLNNYCP